MLCLFDLLNIRWSSAADRELELTRLLFDLLYLDDGGLSLIDWTLTPRSDVIT